MVDVAASWGTMDAEEEEDRALPLQEEYIAASPNSRIRWSKQRIVVRYPSEKYLLREPEEPTIIISDDGFDNQENTDEIVVNVDDDQQESDKQQEENTIQPVEKDGTTTHVVVPTSILKTSNSSVPPQPQRTWSQRVAVQRYVPKFAPPPPQPEEADNGEDEEESEEEEEEVDEEGYDSVVEDEGAEDEEDPIKKIAEEITTSRQQKFQVTPQNESKTSGQDDMLKTISHIKDQLRDEVEKAEQASKAAAEAAQQAEESNLQLASKMANMRSFLAVLCGCGVRIVGMLVAAKLFDTAAIQMKTHTRSLLPMHLLPSILQQWPPVLPHLAAASSVSLTHALLRHFLPRLRWQWLAGVDGAVGALVSICAAALGGARGGRALGSAMAAGCIVGIIASSCFGGGFSKKQQTTTISKQQINHFSGE